MLLQVLQARRLILWDLERAVDGAQRDEARGDVDEVGEAAKHIKITKVFVAPGQRDAEVPHGDDGEGHVAAQLQDQA